jgi:chemotaxis protein methyltransferase CheR
MQAKESSWVSLYKGLKAKTGLDLHDYKQDQLRRRILTMVDSKGAKDLDDFARIVLGDASNVQWFMDRLAINVSELFRNPEKWRELENIVLPELIAKSRTLKCWSAGCSYGAEAHSLAAVFAKKFPGNHSIVGTDIDAAALAQANAGQFSEQDVRGVPDNYKAYFEKRGDEHFAKPELRKYLSFKRGNLLNDRFDSGFDLIMCRNVVIYFTDEAKDNLYRRFFEALKPGGILFVGSTERIFNAKAIGFEAPVSFFYQRPTEGGQLAWRNAS